MLNKVSSVMRESPFNGSRGKVLARFLSIEGFGRLTLRFSIASKQLCLFMGYFSQRAVEYPWMIKQLSQISVGSVVLDVGCAESLFGHELTSKGFRVVGLDIRDCPFKNKKMLCVQRNIMATGLPSNFFDAIIMVSTVEHIGLNAYQQLSIEDQGDFKAMAELHRILKPAGLLLMSTPYIGTNPLKVDFFERNYNRTRLNKLIHIFSIVKEEYYYPQTVHRHVHWQKLGPKEMDKQTLFSSPGLACLILKKQDKLV